MTRAWKPGDVALIPFARGDIRAMFTTDGWAISDAPDVRGIKEFSDVHPLVVIDPEDREEVERFALLVWPKRLSGPLSERSVQMLTDAMHEFASPTPPKPEEPMGFASAVEDRNEIWWTRTGTGPRSGDWCNVDGDHVDYADIDVVRVLSEGVTA